MRVTGRACAVALLAGLLGALLAPRAGAANGAPAPVLPDPFPAAARAYLVQVDGRELWGHAVAQPLPAASLAKMMTALLVDERADAADAVVTISPAAAAAEGTRLGLRRGERMRVSALLASMLVRSANDSCLALAQWQAGSEAAFVARMNARAAALGLGATHFSNACGFDTPGQASSVRDLVALAQALLARPRLAAIVALRTVSVSTQAGRTFAVASTNALLGRVPGIVGVKTGYTQIAGRCAVVVAERNGVRVSVALLGAGERWWDAVAMIEQAFAAQAAAQLAPR